jgi:hypothetical protein
MLRIRSISLLLLFISTLIAATSLESQAQELQSGTWTGVVLPPNGQEMDVTFDVTSTADSLGIQMIAGPMGSFMLNDIELSSDQLSFTWRPGPVVYCDLKKKANGSYEGPCAPEGDEEGIIRMTPPKENN